MRKLRDARRLRGARQPGKPVGLKILQHIDGQFTDEELVLPMREKSFRRPSRSLYCASVLGFTSSRASIACDAVVQLWTMDCLVLAFGIQRAMLRFGSRPVAHTERLARIPLVIGGPGEPDRAVAILVVFLLVGLEAELMDPAIDGMPTVDREGQNRIITPVFVPPLVQLSVFVSIRLLEGWLPQNAELQLILSRFLNVSGDPKMDSTLDLARSFGVSHTHESFSACRV